MGEELFGGRLLTNVRYSVKVENSQNPLVAMQYEFKPVELENSLGGTVEINNMKGDTSITLSSDDRTCVYFKGKYLSSNNKDFILTISTTASSSSSIDPKASCITLTPLVASIKNIKHIRGDFSSQLESNNRFSNIDTSRKRSSNSLSKSSKTKLIEGTDLVNVTMKEGNKAKKLRSIEAVRRKFGDGKL